MKFYAGSLTRFFLGDWGHSRIDGDDRDDAGEEDATPEQVRQYFTAFRDTLATELKPHAAQDLSWSEDAGAEHMALSIEDDGFTALMIIASRAYVNDKRLTPIVWQRDWFEDPAVVQVQDAEDSFLPIHHLVKADSWLPVEFATLVESEVPERDLILGSLPSLARALADLHSTLNMPNEVTRKLPAAQVAAARDAHSALTTIVAWATEHGVPLLIDP